MSPVSYYAFPIFFFFEWGFYALSASKACLYIYLHPVLYMYMSYVVNLYVCLSCMCIVCICPVFVLYVFVLEARKNGPMAELPFQVKESNKKKKKKKKKAIFRARTYRDRNKFK